MRLMAFGVRDIKAEGFTQPPIFVAARGLALRAFTQLVNDPSTEPGKYPQDFQLFELGEFDQVTGELYPREGGPLELGSGLAYKEKA